MKKSREYLNMAMNIYIENKDTLNIANSLNQIGSVYWQNNQYKEALNYYQQAYTLRNHFGNKEELARSTENIANAYKKPW